MNKLALVPILKLSLLLFILQHLCIKAQGQHVRFVPERGFEADEATISTALQPHNTTANSGPSGKSSWEGYVGAVVAVIFFGSNFVPVKKFETGDGMFFQWVFCAAIWIAGLITNCVQNFPTFYPLAMMGGFLWTTGNICSVPIIKTIGLGLGLLLWGSFNLLSGWITGRFGWFGLHRQVPNDVILNYLAIGFAMLSAVCWMFVKSQPNLPIVLEDDDDDPPLLSDDVSTNVTTTDTPWEMRLSPFQRRLFGVTLSIFSGIMYGVNFIPVIYIKDNYPEASKHDIDYVFAHFCGIFLTSTVYFVIYCAFKKNQPMVYPRVILPAVISGAMWAAADIGWFIANNFLTEAVSFPIITTGPGIVASLWGVLVFREIRGLRNYLIMSLAYSLTIAGAVLAGFSKS